jgi:cytochrome P450
MTLLVAGHETTASALTWALYWLHYLPEVEEKLRQELANLMAPANLDEVVKLPYLNALCCETLRIYPIALTTSPRILQAPLELMGYHFEPGTVLTPCIYLVHRREDIYPEPEKFKPERFLERSFSAYEYFPFGGGNRRCIGRGLALLEMKLVLFTLMSRFEFSLCHRRPVKPVRRGVTAAPPGNLKMAVSARLPEK